MARKSKNKRKNIIKSRLWRQDKTDNNEDDLQCRKSSNRSRAPNISWASITSRGSDLIVPLETGGFYSRIYGMWQQYEVQTRVANEPVGMVRSTSDDTDRLSERQACLVTSTQPKLNLAAPRLILNPIKYC